MSTLHTPFITESMFSIQCDPFHVLQDYGVHHEEPVSGSDGDVDSFGDMGSLSVNLAQLKFDPFVTRFMGQSSGSALLRSALELKREHTQHPLGGVPREGAPMTSANGGDIMQPSLFAKRRPEYWEMQDVRDSLPCEYSLLY